MGGAENKGKMAVVLGDWVDWENKEETRGGAGWWFGSGGDPKEEETMGWRRRRMGQDP